MRLPQVWACVSSNRKTRKQRRRSPPSLRPSFPASKRYRRDNQWQSQQNRSGLSDIATPDPMQFIAGAENRQKDDTETKRSPVQKRRKEPVIIRFDEKTISQIDHAAAKRGLS